MEGLQIPFNIDLYQSKDDKNHQGECADKFLQAKRGRHSKKAFLSDADKEVDKKNFRLRVGVFALIWVGLFILFSPLVI